ncbi:hypothetical protein [Clostridium novyi]|uniref:Uncharacterized protein n=1 Tax=Clostridium novyi B str. ATCC 27606 TaxID=1443123 RepID=A0AA40IS24_CLONO|nr:hypothetical protein Z959_p0052 [Clostridium novyi B str. ATCC 27606]KLU74255.1 TIR-like domain-containing protein [Clostridium botulinum V891]
MIVLDKSKWSDVIKKWNLQSLKLSTKFLELEFKPSTTDKEAAWALYVELLTRITTQSIEDEYGEEKAALDSIYNLFNITRNTIKQYGIGCKEFTKIAIVVLNRVIRPFTSKWHKLSSQEAFKDNKQCELFREELKLLQQQLKNYNNMLADMAGVEDLTNLEEFII